MECMYIYMHVCLHLWILHSFFTSLDLAPFVSQTPFPPFLPRTDTLLTPAVDWYLPATHDAQRTAADAFEYEPAWHGVQAGSDTSGVWQK